MPITFPDIIISDNVPEGTIYLVPSVEYVRHIVKATGEVKEFLRYDSKQAAVITNIGDDK